ncbi:hypothetical protein KHP57_01970 [Algiphilus sp. NNCM1]|uniref:hypothetical protein n=1 Tax=Algiphilus sp. TaxID=1872431 RepID=UPI001CA698B0|nr:hypothetical protein [Algiphilus sp.]MBY8964457.1 hypothetical protein [Algiphilus acroporae]MCI5063717.1 hypothetical protein [Algiphilus sp.]MCI5103141.1 hypothetical protein [Algiphilus sp.]
MENRTEPLYGYSRGTWAARWSAGALLLVIGEPIDELQRVIIARRLLEARA